MTEFVLGVDGGGTKTRVVLCDLAGTVVGVGSAGPGNPREVGEERVVAAIDTALAAARPGGARTDAIVRAAFIGCAGVATAAERTLLVAALADIDALADSIVAVDHDLKVAQVGAFAGSAGVLVIAGTGASCFARDIHGDEHRTGGLGAILDDGGSGFDLGRRALVALARGSDGRGPVPVWADEVFDALDADDLRDVVRRTTEPLGVWRPAVAALAPIVCAAAARGDELANAILDGAAEELADCVAANVAAGDWADGSLVPVAFSGGLARGAAVYRERLAAAVRERVPGASLGEPRLEPAAGAVLLALDAVERAIDADLVARLAAGLDA